eukprot:TRINITY_DN1195_c0_g1_i1.p1 TRINITY_DN1195_c0_g1~~TRINITY_DN1195_c0_g1_i1.p1  ORF type:complete len:214 (-),score=55.39 TRINITY_DN1195_c0_g1_i1:25-666(-)
MLARANNIAGNVPRGCAGGRSRSGGFCRRSRHDWQPVLEALSVLEARQAAVQKEMQALRESAACQLEASRQAVAKKDEEIAGIRAASAAAAFQFQRQNSALAGRAALASKKAKRAKSVGLQAKAAARLAQISVEEMKTELQGAVSALVAKEDEGARLRRRVADLEAKLEESERTSLATSDMARQQELLLNEAAVVIRSQMKHRPTGRDPVGGG